MVKILKPDDEISKTQFLARFIFDFMELYYQDAFLKISEKNQIWTFPKIEFSIFRQLGSRCTKGDKPYLQK